MGRKLRPSDMIQDIEDLLQQGLDLADAANLPLSAAYIATAIDALRTEIAERGEMVQHANASAFVASQIPG